MPTYAYLCTDCAHAFDIHQSFTDDSLTVCPSCGGRLRKKFGSVGVSFKGSGFYRNDSRSDAGSGARSAAATSGGSSGSSGGSGPSGSESGSSGSSSSSTSSSSHSSASSNSSTP